MNLKGILTLSIATLVSFILVIATFLVFNPIKEEKQRQITLSKIETVLSEAKSFELNGSTKVGETEILLSSRVFGTSDKELGYVYEINQVNGFGNIKLLIAADATGTIVKIQIIELNQTMYQTQTESLIQSYVDQKLDQIIDLQAGATSVSLNTVMRMFNDLSSHHALVPQFDTKLPYEAFYGNSYTIETTENKTIQNATILIENISSGLGRVYSLTKEGAYETGSSTLKSIQLIIILDGEGKILAMQLPFANYKHSAGSYYRNTQAYAATFVGTNLSDVEDIYSGASNSDDANNSRTLVHNLLTIAKEDSLA